MNNILKVVATPTQKYPQINFNNEQTKEQRLFNSLFKINIKQNIKKLKHKKFILTKENLFVSSK